MSKIAFLFPGQGAQTVGMCHSLCQELPAAKALFDQAGEILGYDLADICFNGPVEKLNSTVISQPALYVSSMAALEKLKIDAPEAYEQCAGAAGLSLGGVHGDRICGWDELRRRIAAGAATRTSHARRGRPDAKFNGQRSGARP